jgi:hypothetical protein
LTVRWDEWDRLLSEYQFAIDMQELMIDEGKLTWDVEVVKWVGELGFYYGGRSSGGARAPCEGIERRAFTNYLCIEHGSGRGMWQGKIRPQTPA